MKRILLALGLLVLPLLGWAQSCPYWQQITFVDGKKACLGEYELLRTPLPDVGRSVQMLADYTRGLYSVSVPIGDASCPMVMGAAFETSHVVYFAPELAVQRASNSMRACDTRLSQVTGISGCACAQVVADGSSRLTKAEFDARFRGGNVSPQVVAVQAPPVAAPTAAATTAPQAPRLTAHALVIGNSRYSSFGALANPVRDARAIANKLKSFGIPVDLLLDAQRDDLIHALNEHSRRAAGKDLSILFYAGHGVQVEGTNYLIPVNMRADGLSAGYVKLAGISLNATLDYMPGKTRLIFLDACRDNPAARALVSSRSASAPGLAAVNAASGTLFSYATRDGATADDGDGLNSPYTTALLQHLDKPMDISLVLRQVRQTVLQLTGGRQEPWEYGSLVGDQIVLPLMAR